MPAVFYRVAGEMTGFKVYRKLWHMSAVWVPLVYWHAVPKRTAVSLALAAFIIALAIDIDSVITSHLSLY
jgi:hypothetical protein